MAAVSLLDVKSCLIDGEAVVCDEQGLAVFSLLRRGGRIKHEAHLIGFDLLELNGRDLRRQPIETRKSELARIVESSVGKERHALGAAPANHPGLQLSEHVELSGVIVFAHACQLGCEGIVSKRLGSPYQSGPTKCADWVKVRQYGEKPKRIGARLDNGQGKHWRPL